MDGKNYLVELIAAAAGLGWVGNSIVQYLKSKGDVDIKRIETQAEVNDLKEDIELLGKTIASLELDVQKYKELAQTENEGRMRTEQQLATINIAFDIIYIQLKKILGNDEQHADLLNQLKKYIDGTPTNMGL